MLNKEKPSINVLTFWGELCLTVKNDDLDGFKKLISTDYSSIDDDKYITAIMIVHDKPKFMEHLIFECGITRKDMALEYMNTISEKLFLTQELMSEKNNNHMNKNKSKI